MAATDDLVAVAAQVVAAQPTFDPSKVFAPAALATIVSLQTQLATAQALAITLQGQLDAANAIITAANNAAVAAKVSLAAAFGISVQAQQAKVG